MNFSLAQPYSSDRSLFVHYVELVQKRSSGQFTQEVDIGQYNSEAMQYLYKITLNVHCINAEIKQDCLSIKGRHTWTEYRHAFAVLLLWPRPCPNDLDRL